MAISGCCQFPLFSYGRNLKYFLLKRAESSRLKCLVDSTKMVKINLIWQKKNVAARGMGYCDYTLLLSSHLSELKIFSQKIMLDVCAV